MRYIAFILALVATPAFAAAPSPGAHYDACLARAQSDPSGALLDADSWAKSGGGAAADHCMALALVGLHRYAEAAAKLDALARGPFAANAAMRSALYDQAGNAWLLASRPDGAIASFSAALAVNPLDADVLADRARAYALRQAWAKAESDLTAALLVNPGRADLYVMRGSARHALGRKGEARADFDLALRIDPRNADALVERGTSKFEAGDVAGARADWQSAVGIDPNGEAGRAARQRLDDSAQPVKP